ncbi:MAG: hypothetical protein JSV16_15000 [Candidatus Hydrogenedentota bacterium]|nr:MAG: hypothetical protein JSV16_15000 [Candidatus Hydrogenedentota bacterium]
MDLLIRKARPDDAEAIVHILNPIVEARRYTVLDTPFTAEAAALRLAEAFQTCQSLGDLRRGERSKTTGSSTR